MRRRTPRAGAAVAFHDAGRPGGSTPWRHASWCAIDLELTGLDPRRHEIIAVGAVPVEEGRVVLGAARYTLVRPSHAPKHDAVLVHKLRLADLLDAPPIEYALDLVLETLAGRVPVFHTAAVERAFLTPLFAARRVRLPAAADTEVLGRLWLGERDGGVPAGVALGRLSEVLGFPAEPPHHALGDAVTTAQAFVGLASHLDRTASQTVASLVHAAERLGGFRGR
ncbi:MAG TPA: exonuclease domain-containing protein [Solirubrobacteraceae bacterium]|nr:exonuclease domain-containing protein [Solirubrobacteraceae bacterium]